MKNLDSKALDSENLDLENLGHKKCGKQLDLEKWLEDYLIQFIITENLLRRDFKQTIWKSSYWGFLRREKICLIIKMNSKVMKFDKAP